MDTRQLGTTGHESTVLTLGSILLDDLTQEAASRAVELALDFGVNHVDVAPKYGDAELKLGPTLRKYRDDLFLGCKTRERDAEGVRRMLDRSLNHMGIDTVDLYQFHAVTNRDELDAITEPGGALDAFREAKAEGLVDHIGLTSHGSPDVILEAIDRIDELETVMFPLNSSVLGKTGAKYDYRAVLDRCRHEEIGTIGIKAFAKQSWPPESELRPENRPYRTWYEPHDSPAAIQDCLNFVLSQGLTTVTTAGDPKLLSTMLHAAENFEPLTEGEQETLMRRGRGRNSPVPADR